MRRWMILIVVLLLLPSMAWPGNTHGTPSEALERGAWFGDALAGYVVSGCLPGTSGTTTTATFACNAYVKASGTDLVYVTQPTKTVGALPSTNGTYWIAVHRDISTAVGDWTRQAGTHYLWKTAASATQVANPTNGLVIAGATVSGCPGSCTISAIVDARLPRSYVKSGRFDITDPLYGAVSGSDSTTAIQAAIKGANGRGPVYIPSGTFTVTTGFTGIAANQEIMGDGYSSHLSASLSTGILFDIDAARCFVHDFRISGTMGTGIRLQDDADFCRVERMDISGAVGGSSVCQSGIGVCPLGADDVTIRGNTFSANGDNAGNGGDIVQFTGGNRYHVTENHCLSTTAGYGIQLASTFDSVIANNTINQKQTAGDNGGYGITIYNDPAGSGGRNVVIGNRIANTEGTGIYVLRSPYTIVASNVLETVATAQTGALAIGGIVMVGDSTTESENCVITGNTIRNSGHAGIRFDGLYCQVAHNIIDTTGTLTARPGIYSTRAANGSIIQGNSITGSAHSGIDITASIEDVIIANNVIDTPAASASANGIILNTCTDCIIASNRVEKAGARGIYVLGTRNTIVNNTVVDSSQAAANTYEGIRNESTYARIAGNHSYNTGGTGQSYGILTNANYVVIQDNEVITNQTAGLSISGTAVQRNGNRVSIDASQGTATLVAGSATVATAEVLAATNVLITRTTAGGTHGQLRVTNFSAGVSFDIVSDNAADTSTVFWQIVH